MKCKCRVRWFSSKGAFLVLLWTLLNLVACMFLFQVVLSVAQAVDDSSYSSQLLFFIIPLSVSMLSAPLSAWLADAKFGNYKVFKVSSVLLFISAVINCLLLILEELVWERSFVLKWIHLLLGSSLFVVSGCACFVTALPLGLDQMPDASSSSITSYIAWFVCSIFCGGLLFEVLDSLGKNCLNDKRVYIALALISSLCMGIVLVSNFLYSPKWLIIEPKSPQSLKTIYQVLKFAAKHKAPLNRSALTYWEEDVPLRMDLGKLKYGGPFTTEQVEDVKTILSLLAIALPLLFLSFSLMLDINISNNNFPDINFNICSTQVFLHKLPYSSSLYGIFGTFAYEFVIFPVARNRLPSILRRISSVPLLMILFSLTCIVLTLVLNVLHFSKARTEWMMHLLLHSTNGLLSQVLLTSELEFMCAQSPYNMRGLLVSLAVPPFMLYIGAVGWSVGYNLVHKVCTQLWCYLLPFLVKISLAIIGFILFHVVARWYKMRVRDEDYSPQRVVEEVYDRYLTAAAAQSRTYGTSS